MMLPKPSECSGCPLYEKPFGKKTGFSQPDGDGTSGVLVIAEALGEAEELEGKPLVGKSGHALFQQLARVGVERDTLTLWNVLGCRPPDNKLLKMSYELPAIKQCAVHRDPVIEHARAVAKANGKTFVIVTLGETAFRTILGLDPQKDRELIKLPHYAYPIWSDIYKVWVINAPHPAYLVRGKTYLWSVVQFVFKRALEIADSGLTLDTPDYILDPSANIFDYWIAGYKASLESVPDNPLSYDIETPYKKKTKDEEELGKEEAAEFDDHTILRIAFSYLSKHGDTHTISVKWSAEYLAGIEQLFNFAPFVLGWNSDNYDFPRVSRFLKIKGISLDGMVAWHILNTSLPKSLGFVTPFYWHKTDPWKHLSSVSGKEAFYNAKDADAALRNFVGIKKDLIENDLWHVYQRHWIELSVALRYMSGKGVLRDSVMRAQAEADLSDMLEKIAIRMEGAIPKNARKFKIYKKQPKSAIPGLVEQSKAYPVKYCEVCGLQKPTRWKKHGAICGGKETTIDELQVVWAEPLEFKVSKQSLQSYQKSLSHMAIINHKEKKVTFNADALAVLVKRYPKDQLYPAILEHRKVQKLLSTYIGYALPNGKLTGGMPVGPDGRIHTVYGRHASTLRFTSEDPNLQNLPRPNPKDANDISNIIRNLVVAEEGATLYARDYSGIEAVLTGYFALDPDYIRLAKRDVHTYYTVHALYELEGGARVKSSDLPDIGWEDSRLFPYLAQLKKDFSKERNSLYKHLVHAANFMQGAKGAQAKIFSETGIEYPLKTVQKVMDVYYSLFPKIRHWHKNVLDEAEKDGYLRNPFGYVHRFNRPYDYKKEFGEWIKRPGPDANAVIAMKPQSTAVGIITEAILRLYYTRFEEAGQYMRLQVHDEIMFEAPDALLAQIDQVAQEEMERPIPEMRLPESWGMGSQLVVLTESKQGKRWGGMH